MEKCPIFNTLQAKHQAVKMTDVHRCIAATTNMRYQERKAYFARHGLYYNKVQEYYPIVTRLNKLLLQSDVSVYRQNYEDLLDHDFLNSIVMRPRKNQQYPYRNQNKRSDNKGQPPR